MWKHYFSKGHIFGVDLHDKSFHDEARIKTFAGSQVDHAFLDEVVKRIGKSISLWTTGVIRTPT